MPLVITPPPIPAALTHAIEDQRSYATIASIWPIELVQEEPHWQRIRNSETGEVQELGCTTYRIPASSEAMVDAPQNIQLLRVHDSYQVRTVPGPEHRREPLPLWCKDIAEALVQRWSGVPGGARSGSSIGLLVLAGEEPTAQEVQMLLRAQNAFFQERFNQANEDWRQGNVRRIGKIERIAARWMNMHDRVEWATLTAVQNIKECIGCGGSMPSQATTCKTCGDLLAKALDGYWSETELKVRDENLYQRMLSVRARRKDRDRKREERGSEDKE